MKNYDGFRAGMLRAAEIARNEFKQAPEAAKGHDCVWMGGYESACDHLSIVIAQAAVIDSVRIAGAQPDWQYHIALLLPDGGIEDQALLKIYQVVEHELRTARADAIGECVVLAHAMATGETYETGRQKALNIAAALEQLKNPLTPPVASVITTSADPTASACCRVVAVSVWWRVTEEGGERMTMSEDVFNNDEVGLFQTEPATTADDAVIDDDEIDLNFDSTPPRCAFVTGAAGTGKTYQVRERIRSDPREGLLCATTGIAGVNLEP